MGLTTIFNAEDKTESYDITDVQKNHLVCNEYIFHDGKHWCYDCGLDYIKFQLSVHWCW